MNECPETPGQEHSWCPCFGSCECGKTLCSMCGAEQASDDAERSAS